MADPPTASDDEAAVTDDGIVHEIDVLANDSSDPDDTETLTITSVTEGSEGGTIEISSDGLTIEYTAPSGFVGTETFDYTIEDEDGLTATATVTVTVTEPANAVLSGFVYIDSNNDGVRDTDEVGVPGALVTLTGTTTSGGTVTQTALTADDGSYSFTELAAGTYQLTETQPAALTDGTDATDDADATVGDDVISNIAIDSTEESAEHNFGERRLLPQYSSIAWFFASTQANDAFFREMIAKGEQDAGNDDFATAIRDGETTFESSTVDAESLTADASSTAAATTAALSALAAAATSASSNGAQIVSAPTSGVATLGSAGAVSYVPTTVATGVDTFTYQTVDDSSSPVQATVTVTTTGDDGSTATTAGALDAALTVDPLYGTADVGDDGSFVYLPEDGVFSSDTFAYWLSNGTSSANVTISIVADAASTAESDGDSSNDANGSDSQSDDASAESSDAAIDVALATTANWLVA